MLYQNYGGLTFRWSYGHTVNVFDGQREVDVYSIGFFGDNNVPYQDFMESIPRWYDYMREAVNDEQSYNTEDDSWDDADSLVSIGWGTDEDYGYFGD